MTWKQLLLPAGIAGIGTGMALVYAGVIMRGVFLPGTLIILVGMLLCAVGGVSRLLERDVPHE